MTERYTKRTDGDFSCNRCCKIVKPMGQISHNAWHKRQELKKVTQNTIVTNGMSNHNDRWIDPHKPDCKCFNCETRREQTGQ